MGLTKVKIDNFNPTPRIDEYTLRIGRAIVAWFLWFMFAAAAVLFLVSRAEAQNTMAPFKTQQVNTTYYVGQASLATIQKAVTAACASAPGGRVVIQAGITPPDTIGAVTGGCTKAPIVDERALPDACFTWNGSAYVVGACASGTGTPPVVAGSVQTADATQTHLVGGGITNSEVFNTGNNGVQAAQALGLKDIYLPATTASTENFIGNTTLDQTQVWDRRFGQLTEYHNNVGTSQPGLPIPASTLTCNDSLDFRNTVCRRILDQASGAGIDNQWTFGVNSHQAITIEQDNLTPGIGQVFGIVQTGVGGDDLGGFYLTQQSMRSRNSSSSEASLMMSLQGRELAGVSGTVSVTAGIGATTVQTNMVGIGPQLQLIDWSDQVGTGYITSLIARAGQELHGFNTSDTHAASTGFGHITAACGASHPTNQPASYSCAYSVGSAPEFGQFCAAGLWNGSACTGTATNHIYIGDIHNPECAVVNAVSGGVLTVSMIESHPGGTPIYQGGGACDSLILNGGQTNPVLTENKSMPAYQIAGARSTTEYDYFFQLLQSQQGNPQINFGNASFAVISASRTGTTVTLTFSQDASVLNGFALPSATSLCYSGGTPSTLNECFTTSTVVASNNGLTLTYTSGTSGAASTTGGTFAIVDTATHTLNGFANYTVATMGIVSKVVGANANPALPGIRLGNGLYTLQANNGRWLGGDVVLGPRNPSAAFSGARLEYIYDTPNATGPAPLLSLRQQGDGSSGTPYFCANCEGTDPATAYSGYGGGRAGHHLGEVTDQGLSSGIHFAGGLIQNGTLFNLERPAAGPYTTETLMRVGTDLGGYTQTTDYTTNTTTTAAVASDFTRIVQSPSRISVESNRSSIFANAAGLGGTVGMTGNNGMDLIQGNSFFEAVFHEQLDSSAAHFCMLSLSSAPATQPCINGATNVNSSIAGFYFDATTQQIGGQFGRGGSITLIGNTPGDTQTGGLVNLGASTRGDGLRNAVEIFAGGTTGLRVDGDFSGHTLGNVGAGYTSAQPIPYNLAVKGSFGFDGTHATTGFQGTTGTKLLTCAITTFTSTDLVTLDANGNCVDSGILSGALVLLNAANQFGNSTQTFGLTAAGQTQISNAGIKGINTSLAQTYFLDNATGKGTFAGFGTNTNCSSAAAPAVCGAAAAGSVVIATSATSVTVNTTAVTANSQILITPDASLGTKLGVTCNSTTSVALAGFGVTARVAGTSFTLSTLGTVATNPACYSYSIIN